MPSKSIYRNKAVASVTIPVSGNGCLDWIEWDEIDSLYFAVTSVVGRLRAYYLPTVHDRAWRASTA